MWPSGNVVHRLDSNSKYGDPVDYSWFCYYELVIAFGLERSNICVIYVLFSCHIDRLTDSDYRLCDFYAIKRVGIDTFIVYVITLIENACKTCMRANACQRSMSRKCMSEEHACAHALKRAHASCVL